jgi:uncharacterized protein (TIGR04255 family)
MAQYTHLNRAPIVEALIDFRVKPKEGLQVDDLLAIYEKVKDRYPIRKSIRRFKAEISVKYQEDGTPVGDLPPAATLESAIGHRFESKDGRYVLQAQLHGFTLSRLKPYETWEALIGETRSLWELYLAIAAPISITRIATRYINRIEIPLPITEFEEYLTVPPDVPEGVPELVSEFLSRIVSYDPRLGASMIITQACEGYGASSAVIPLLLDIDVFKQANFDVNSEDYWNLITQFRSLKNKAFFGSITEKTKALLI